MTNPPKQGYPQEWTSIADGLFWIDQWYYQSTCMISHSIPLHSNSWRYHCCIEVSSVPIVNPVVFCLLGIAKLFFTYSKYWTMIEVDLTTQSVEAPIIQPIPLYPMILQSSKISAFLQIRCFPKILQHLCEPLSLPIPNAPWCWAIFPNIYPIDDPVSFRWIFQHHGASRY